MTYDAGGVNAISLALADVNGDDKTDVTVANSCASGGCAHGDDSVGVLLNNTADTTLPLISLSAAPPVLWPADGKTIPVTVSGTITDAGSGVNGNTVTYDVTDEYAEVEPSGTITVGPDGKYSLTILLHASRQGTDRDGRRYLITIRASDNAGNAGSKTSVVTVPHDKR